MHGHKTWFSFGLLVKSVSAIATVLVVGVDVVGLATELLAVAWRPVGQLTVRFFAFQL